MGASATSRLSNKDYSIIVIYATENEKVLDLTTKNNVKCYTWSLLKRLSTTTSQYTPTNKMVKFVKSKTDTFSNVKVVTLSNFYGTYAEAKAELESISNKTDIEKFTTEIYRNCIAKSYEDVTYDQFRYMLRRSNFKRLTTITSIEKHNLDEYLEPHFKKLIEVSTMTHKTPREILSPYIKNKIYNHIKAQMEAGNHTMNDA